MKTFLFLHQRGVVSGAFTQPLPSPVQLSVRFTVSCCSFTSPVTDVNLDEKSSEIRLRLPSKGLMASDTLDLLKDCQLSARQTNPWQCVADIPQIANLEVWFQRPEDMVSKLASWDLDLGTVGLDTFGEYGQQNEDPIIVDTPVYEDCLLSLAIPKHGIFKNMNSVKELAQMLHWTTERPLRVVTCHAYVTCSFLSLQPGSVDSAN